MNLKSYRVKILTSLFLQFFKIGAVTFGGGLAMLPLFKRDLVQTKKWISEEEMIDYFSIAQCTPGVIAVNTATFVGHKKAGFLGSLFATLGVITPSIIIITIIAMLVSNFSDITWMQKALKGVNVAVAVLLLKAVTGFSKRTIIDVFTFLIALSAFVCIFFLGVPAVWIVLGSATVGFIIRTIVDLRHPPLKNTQDESSTNKGGKE